MDAFAELKPALGSDEALSEANRCLMCYDAPCTRACPTHIDVPAFIKKIASGNLLGSARTILSANILGASCARVCPTEVLCEGACVLNHLHHKPIDIGRLQRHATDHLTGKNLRLFSPAPRREHLGQVAIVGGGPSGLACAAELSRLGVGAVVFDAAERPGGLNTYGVAEYKLTPKASLREVEWVEQHGVEIRSNARVGDGGTLGIGDLERDYAAVFVGVGLGKVSSLRIPGEDLPGVVDALDFIAELKLHRERVTVGKRVVVVGGGNTAIDAVTQAARLGAEEVSLVYRRGPGSMTAYAHEVELARKVGCRLVFHAQPSRVVGGARVEGLECLRTQEAPAAASSRSSAPETIAGSEFVIDCDMVIRANGQTAQRAFLESLPDVRLERGRPVVDAAMRTTNPRYFAGGDCVSGGKEVVNAVAEGKLAAQSIVQFLESRAAQTERA